MQELIKKVSETAGISEEQAKKSIETVSKYLKDNVPDILKSQIDNLINGGKLSEGIIEKLKSSAVDAKEKSEDVLKDAAEKTEEILKTLQDKMKELFGDKKESPPK